MLRSELQVVREFIRAAYGRAWAWAMLVTGLYGLLALALPEHRGAHLRLPELPEPAWWIIGAGVFILAPYLAYRQQRLSALHRPIIPRGLKLEHYGPSSPRAMGSSNGLQVSLRAKDPDRLEKLSFWFDRTVHNPWAEVELRKEQRSTWSTEVETLRHQPDPAALVVGLLKIGTNETLTIRIDAGDEVRLLEVRREKVTKFERERFKLPAGPPPTTAE